MCCVDLVVQLNAKPSPPSLMANNNCCRSISYDVYCGRSIWLKPKAKGHWSDLRVIRWILHVCAWGRRSDAPYALWIENLCTPWTPCKSTKPLRGTREVPVAKLRTLARSSRLKDLSARHHQTIFGSELLYPLYSVAARHSSTSMSGVPEMSSSSSCSLNYKKVFVS